MPTLRPHASFITLVVLVIAVVGCAPAPTVPATATPAPLAESLTLMHYEDGFSQALLDRFTEETGVEIVYQGFANYEEGEARLLESQPADLMWLTPANLVEPLARDLLAEIDYANIPNFRNINPSFRDLTFDPGGAHHIPWVWGTTGLVYRSDLVSAAPTRWSDLWTLGAGQAGVWADRRTMFGMALMSLGYSVNTNDTAQLDEAAAFLEERWGQQVFVEGYDAYTSAYALADGTLPISLGWAYDAQTGRGLNETIAYASPEEGTMLWLEVIVIPASSPNKATAEAFINFLLQPENAAVYTNEFSYATVVDGAQPFVDEAIAADRTIFPTTETLAGAELLLPLSPAAEDALNDHWERLVALNATD